MCIGFILVASWLLFVCCLVFGVVVALFAGLCCSVIGDLMFGDCCVVIWFWVAWGLGSVVGCGWAWWIGW